MWCLYRQSDTHTNTHTRAETNKQTVLVRIDKTQVRICVPQHFRQRFHFTLQEPCPWEHLWNKHGCFDGFVGGRYHRWFGRCWVSFLFGRFATYQNTGGKSEKELRVCVAARNGNRLSNWYFDYPACRRIHVLVIWWPENRQLAWQRCFQPTNHFTCFCETQPCCESVESVCGSSGWLSCNNIGDVWRHLDLKWTLCVLGDAAYPRHTLTITFSFLLLQLPKRVILDR